MEGEEFSSVVHTLSGSWYEVGMWSSCRDPNGWIGVAWCFGSHDRPMPERPIFGRVRSMTANGLRTKHDMPSYLRQVGQIIERIKSNATSLDLSDAIYQHPPKLPSGDIRSFMATASAVAPASSAGNSSTSAGGQAQAGTSGQASGSSSGSKKGSKPEVPGPPTKRAKKG
jgi:hypothetical protein